MWRGSGSVQLMQLQGVNPWFSSFCWKKGCQRAVFAAVSDQTCNLVFRLHVVKLALSVLGFPMFVSTPLFAPGAISTISDVSSEEHELQNHCYQGRQVNPVSGPSAYRQSLSAQG